MAMKTVAQKAHVKAGTTIAVINRVPGIVESLGLPKDVVFEKPTNAQLVILFVRTRPNSKRIAAGGRRSGAGSAISVFFRKGSRNAGLDMNRDTVRPLRKSSTCGPGSRWRRRHVVRVPAPPSELDRRCPADGRLSGWLSIERGVAAKALKEDVHGDEASYY